MESIYLHDPEIPTTPAFLDVFFFSSKIISLIIFIVFWFFTNIYNILQYFSMIAWSTDTILFQIEV